MLDIRYFDALDSSQSTHENGLVGYKPAVNSNHVKINKPQTVLEPLVAKLLTDFNISGVILFSENLVNQSQIQTLTSDIKQVASSSSSGQPLLISIDQEGGRVARLPRSQWPAFTGNMAIGALTDDSENMSYKVGEAIGQQLHHLGINVNHAPTIDVNANPNNPVINVRSFSDCPKRVASLGNVMAKGMIASSIIPTFKHFPGHGDTNVDSHTGLPRVDHDLQTVNNVDLLPFISAIKHDCAPMIMTAHIQYPALDNSTFLARDGEQIIKPATLSYDILTTLLREKLCYEGVVITDALDMASISCYLTPVQAVIKTFKAGADIALMPFKIHKPADIVAFSQFFDDIVEYVMADDELYDSVMKSSGRIDVMKKKHLEPDVMRTGFIDTSHKAEHRQLEQHIANHSIVSHSNTTHVELSEIKQVVTVFNNKEQGIALINGLKSCNVLNENVEYRNATLSDLVINEPKSTLLIIGIEDVKSVVDLGGIDDLMDVNDHLLSGDIILKHLINQKEQGGQSVFICLKAPYNLNSYIHNANIALTTFDGSIYQDEQGNWHGAVFNTVAGVISQQVKPVGRLPIQ